MQSLLFSLFFFFSLRVIFFCFYSDWLDLQAGDKYAGTRGRHQDGRPDRQKCMDKQPALINIFTPRPKPRRLVLVMHEITYNILQSILKHGLVWYECIRKLGAISDTLLRERWDFIQPLRLKNICNTILWHVCACLEAIANSINNRIFIGSWSNSFSGGWWVF